MNLRPAGSQRPHPRTRHAAVAGGWVVIFRHAPALLLMLSLGLAPWPADAAPGARVRVVAAESSYGGMVKTIGGDHVTVISVLDSPGVNPHEFEASVQTGRQLQQADLVVMNGLGFDAWIEPLLNGTTHPRRQVIKASDAGRALIMADRNPHLFYAPRIMLATARRVADALARMDPAHAADYRTNLRHFQDQLRPVFAQMHALMAAHPDLAVTATEPVYAYMFRLLGYRDRFHDLQFAQMQGSQPSAQQVRQLMQALQRHEVALLVYNHQVQTRLTREEVRTAQQVGVPTVGVSALPLHGENYAQWQIRQLQAIGKALTRSSTSP